MAGKLGKFKLFRVKLIDLYFPTAVTKSFLRFGVVILQYQPKKNDSIESFLMFKPHKSRVFAFSNVIKTASITPGQHFATGRDANFAVDMFNMIAYGVMAEVELF